LLTGAGALGIAREASTGRISTTTLGAVGTSQINDGYGALATFSASASGAEQYRYELTPDALGRIATKRESVGGETHTTEYGYDDAGRLWTVQQDGVLTATYEYDANGNRLRKTAGGSTEEGTYDDQDRMLSYGGATYTWRPNGELESRTMGGQTTWYGYDRLGNLRQVALPDGRTIEYVVDGLNRRVGKKVNGALVEGFLYEGQLRPVAWLDASGAVKARFVYGTHVNVPEYMVTASGTFRIVTDHLGSPRVVVDAASGAIIQRVDYDEWGVLLADSNPGFQPFGFAGGLRDRDTGLVRFGARDYDPSSGRSTTKDPLGFEGGLSFYEYAGSDPVNNTDPSGLCFKDAFWRTFKSDMKATNHFFFSFPTSLVRTLIGVTTAGAVAETFGTVTPVQAIKSLIWPGLGPRGIATLGVGGTAAAAVANIVINTIAVTGALELGIVIGSAADSLGWALADDAPCKDSCSAN
jgi:RHS repeat-associated protein